MSNIFELKKAIALISFKDKDVATAFLISENALITAKHAVVESEYGSNTDFEVRFPFADEPEQIYIVADIDYFNDETNNDVDVAIFVLAEKEIGITPFEIGFLKCEENIDWESYGFPKENDDKGAYFSGNVNSVFPENRQALGDMNLYCEKLDINFTDYEVKQASGSPIIVDGKAIALIYNHQRGKILGAASLYRAKELILKYITKEIPISKTPVIIPYEEQFKLLEEKYSDIANVEIEGLKKYLQDNPQLFETFLSMSKYPVYEFDPVAKMSGLYEILEILLFSYTVYGNLEFKEEEDMFIRLQDTENMGAKNSMQLLYASIKSESIAEIVFTLHERIKTTVKAESWIKYGLPVPPHLLIIDNARKRTNRNMCKECGDVESVNFQGILKSFVDPEDDGMYKGIQKNNYESLKKVKVLCADCIRNLLDESNEEEQFEREMFKELVVN